MLSDGQRTYTWEHGRQLQSVTAGNTTWTNCYDENGIRTERTRGTVSYKYSYEGGKLKYMSVGSNKLYFTYDFNGAPLSVNYNGTEYYYVTNLQGDVVAILNAAGTAVVTYTYDAWGNPLTQSGSMSATLGTHNPLRYRGYVYDTETGLYYLQSRYYDPEIGRFINADVLVSTGQGVVGNNMFAYCLNNPVNMFDMSGEIALSVLLGKALLGAAVNVLTTYIGAKVTGQDYTWKDAGIAALSGALGTGGTALNIAAGAVSGIYSGVMAHKNGASTGKAVLSGLVSAWGTTVSVSNIAGWTGPALDLGVSAFTDVVFGTASNSIAAVTYRASIETSSNKTSDQGVAQCTNNLSRSKLYTDMRLR